MQLAPPYSPKPEVSPQFQESLKSLSLLASALNQQTIALVEGNNTQLEPEEGRCIHELFEAQVEQTPDAVAVQSENEQLTYRELNIRANKIAHYLRTLGVGKDVLVGLSVERSPLMIVGLLAILKAGGAYVPLDPSYPLERLDFMLEDARTPVLLTQSNLVKSLPKTMAQIVCLDTIEPLVAQHSEENPISGVTLDELIYVIYTSGSTGKPKGVLIPHRAVNRLVVHTNYVNLEPTDVVAQVSNCSFDAATFEIWGALANGAKLVIINKNIFLSPKDFAACLGEENITVLFLTTALFNYLARENPAAFSGVKYLLFGGEAADPRCVKKLLASGYDQHLLHVYGPTESTTFASYYWVQNIPEEATTIPIGRPISQTQMYIVDEKMQPVTIGTTGELYIGGAGLAKGYLNRPFLTDERFIPNPFSDRPDERLYKTGDLARLLPDGNIEFIGRIDHQVKIRGFRIELGEVEAAINQYPEVQEAIVLAKEYQPWDKRLVAYLVLTPEWTQKFLIDDRKTKLDDSAESSPEHNQLFSEIKCFLKEKLPEYMLPSSFVFLDKLPMTCNGKVDRMALLQIENVETTITTSFVAPRNPIESLMAKIWAQVLGLERVSIHDNFFDLGGNSLLATQVCSRVRDSLHKELPLNSFFKEPTVATLAELVIQNQSEALPGNEQYQNLNQSDPLLFFPTDTLPSPENQSTQVSFSAPLSLCCSAPVRLSFAQERLWILDQITPNNPFYNVPTILRLTGKLNVAALENSVNEIVRRHEALRTAFTTLEGQPVQVISSELNLPLTIIDLQELPEAEQLAEARQLANDEFQKPFDLTEIPLLRVTLIRLNQDKHLLLLTMHHIICDGWSMKVFMQELVTYYQAFSADAPIALPDLPIQYTDFAIRQRQYLSGEVWERECNYWKQQLSSVPVLQLPTDRSRTLGQNYRDARQPLGFSKSQTEAIKTLSRSEGVSLYMMFLAAFQVLLLHYTGQDDIIVGSPIANRNRREIEGLIGYFSNTLPMRTDLSGNPTFRELLGRVRQVTLSAYDRQDLPFHQIVSLAESTDALFRVMFNFNASHEVLELPELTIGREVECITARLNSTRYQRAIAEKEDIDFWQQTSLENIEIELKLSEEAEGIVGFFEYSTDLFDSHTICQMVKDFQALVENIIQNPDLRLTP